MADVRCEERVKLEEAVAKAVGASYTLKTAERGPAKEAEREAVKALDQHLKLHGCKR